MRTSQQFSIMVFLVVSLSACQTSLLHSVVNRPDKPDAGSTPESELDLSKLVSEEIVIAAAMPITKDGQDDILEREDDPLPIEPEEQEVINDLWMRLRNGFMLDHHLDSPRVKAEINWYLNHPDYIDRVATRATRYLYQIVGEIERRNLPMELALLPVVESAFDPFAYSHGRASGLWQFIPSTGKLYGLKIDYWYDGRRDIVAATNAALNYLESSHKSLNHDWLLALAAYNSGEGNVRYSMRKNARAGKPTDFFSLGLLRETRAYVPRLLAISEVIANAEHYGISLKPIANEPYFNIVDVGSQIDLVKAAELAQISIEELYLLNPAYNKWSTHPNGPHKLLIPVNKAAGFQEKIADLPNEARISWQRHKIRNGESLGLIAQRYQTTIDTIRRANRIKGNLIIAGESLLIPVATNTSEHYQLSDTERLKSTQAYVEKKLGTEPQRYKVQKNDNLWDLSRSFGVSMRALAKWNGMGTTDLLYPGKELLVFNARKPVEHLATLPDHKQVIRKINYKVRNGESLSRIAHKFNLPVSNIEKWNRKIASQKYIQPGDTITLYVDVTQTE